MSAALHTPHTSIVRSFHRQNKLNRWSSANGDASAKSSRTCRERIPTPFHGGEVSAPCLQCQPAPAELHLHDRITADCKAASPGELFSARIDRPTRRRCQHSPTNRPDFPRTRTPLRGNRSTDAPAQPKLHNEPTGRSPDENSSPRRIGQQTRRHSQNSPTSRPGFPRTPNRRELFSAENRSTHQSASPKLMSKNCPVISEHAFRLQSSGKNRSITLRLPQNSQDVPNFSKTNRKPANFSPRKSRSNRATICRCFQI